MIRHADGIYAMQASILKTMASPRRLEMIHLLGEAGPMEVRRLADYFDLPQPTISQHLAAMRTAGLVEAVRTGREVRYQLVDPDLVSACELMRQVLVRRMARLGDMAASYATQSPEQAPAAPSPSEPVGVLE
jgi:ArsR family transcriptional regulator, virulence genes transcriptional regulator